MRSLGGIVNADMCCGRRAFLSVLGGGLVAAVSLYSAKGRADQGAVLMSCGVDADGRYVAAGIDMSGVVQFELPLPARGHGAVFRRKSSECVVFARRPGSFAGVVDVGSGMPLHWIEAVPGRHFYGHGAFSADGSTLFVAENDYATGGGVLGVYDATDRYRRIGEISSHGIRPHEVRLMLDGMTLAVANGGIRTHPDQGRAKLNLDTMAPSLAFLDARSGALVGQARLPKRFHKLSIRHLDIDRGGRVAIAMQYEGDRRDSVPLVGLYDGDGAVRLLHAPGPNAQRMRQYTGSIAFDVAGEVLAASSPRGHVVTFWDAWTAAYLYQIEATDASGIVGTETPGTFLIAGGDGAIRLADTRTGTATTLRASNGHIRWDNHLCALAAF